MFYGLILLGFIYACGSIDAIIRLFNPRNTVPKKLACRESIFIFTNIIVFLCLVMIVDLKMPLGVDRYFTVLLPPVAFIFGNLADILFPIQTSLQKTMTAIALFTVIAIQLLKTDQLLAIKAAPENNYRELSLFINQSNACANGCWRLDTNFFFHDALAKAPYFDGIKLRKTELNNDLDLKGKLPFIGFHQANLASRLQARNPEAQCWEPRQGRKSHTYIFLEKASDQSPVRHDLVRCDK